MTQIAVKLPGDVLDGIDRLVEEGVYANRSDAVRQALVELIRRRQRLVIDQRFAAGFAANPETDDELADATRLAIESIDDEPWERWW